MNPNEFWAKVKESMRETEGDDPIGCDYFMQDMEELFEKWREESEGLTRSF